VKKGAEPFIRGGQYGYQIRLIVWAKLISSVKSFETVTAVGVENYVLKYNAT
jgi:hypothetical protein